jgi:hypothetical protein
MTLGINVRAKLVRLWKMSMLGIRNVLAWVTDGCNQDAYLLRPRCCRNEQFRESP